MLTGVPGTSAVRVLSLEAVRRTRTVDVDATSPVVLNDGALDGGALDGGALDGGAVVMARFKHPGGITATLPLQTWHRSEVSPVRRLGPAPWPGADTRGVLAEAGYSVAEIDDLFETGVARDGWPVMDAYLPGLKESGFDLAEPTEHAASLSDLWALAFVLHPKTDRVHVV